MRIRRMAPGMEPAVLTRSLRRVDPAEDRWDDRPGGEWGTHTLEEGMPESAPSGLMPPDVVSELCSRNMLSSSEMRPRLAAELRGSVGFSGRDGKVPGDGKRRGHVNAWGRWKGPLAGGRDRPRGHDTGMARCRSGIMRNEEKSVGGRSETGAVQRVEVSDRQCGAKIFPGTE